MSQFTFNFIFLLSSLLILCVFGEDQVKEELKARELLQSAANTTALRHKYCINHKPSKHCSLETHDCPKDQHCVLNLCGDTFCVANNIEELEKNSKKYLPKSYGFPYETCILPQDCRWSPFAQCICFICLPNAFNAIN